MSTFFSFVAIICLLTLEGRLLFRLAGGTRGEKLLAWSIGYPLGTLINTAVFFVLHLLSFHFSLFSVLFIHATLLAGLILAVRTISDTEEILVISAPRHPVLPFWLAAVSLLLVVVTIASALIHVMLLPDFYWDSFTNWAMRSRQLLEAGQLVMTGVIQPQYPILLHALHMVQALPLGWSSTSANMGTLWLSLTGLLSTFLLLLRRYGWRAAIIVMGLLMGLPLLVIHLRQGYADIHVGIFAVLSAALLGEAVARKNTRLLLLSALLCAAACWTKIEALYLALLPWLFIVLLHWRSFGSRARVFQIIVVLLCIVSPWYFFVLAHGLPLSPHGATIAWHIQALPILLSSLLVRGTFGVHWWVILLMLGMTMLRERLHIFSFFRTYPALLWGLSSAILTDAAYLFTEDARGLVQGDNFSRAMLLSTLLLTYGLADLTLRRMQHND